MAQHMVHSLLRGLAWGLVGLVGWVSSGGAQQVLEHRPNLQAKPVTDPALVSTAAGGTQLIFSATTFNTGDGPLELRAGETGSAGQNVYQRVALDNGSFYDRLAGTFVWHPAHNHFHFGDYARYTLQPVQAPGGSQRTGFKTTFCIMDTTPVALHLPGAPADPVYSSCGATVQGLSVGWGDTYSRTLPGQAIDFTGNPSGDYKLTIEVDPDNQLIETTNADNSACTLLRINVAQATVTVLDSTDCTSSPAPVTVTAITPASAPPGSVVAVAIRGTGFVPGLPVTLDNGSGPRPTVSQVVVVDAHLLTANITVKSGGGRRARPWDVRVGSGILANGFTVRP